MEQTTETFSNIFNTATLCRARGQFNQLANNREIIEFFAPVLPGEFSNFKSAGHGKGCNHDLYGFDVERKMAVIQVRFSRRGYGKSYLSVNKDYYLCALNNDGTMSAFMVPGLKVRGAARSTKDNSPEAVVTAALAGLFSLTPAKIRAGHYLNGRFFFKTKNPVKAENMAEYRPEVAKEIGGFLFKTHGCHVFNDNALPIVRCSSIIIPTNDNAINDNFVIDTPYINGLRLSGLYSVKQAVEAND